MTNILLVGALLALVVIAYYVDKLWRTVSHMSVVVGYIYLYLDNANADFGPETNDTQTEN